MQRNGPHRQKIWPRRCASNVSERQLLGHWTTDNKGLVIWNSQWVPRFMQQRDVRSVATFISTAVKRVQDVT